MNSRTNLPQQTPYTSIAFKAAHFKTLHTVKLKSTIDNNEKRELIIDVAIMKLNKVDEAIIKTLKTEGKELTLQELSDKTELPSKKVFKSLRKLFENEMIDTSARKYKLLTDKVPSGKEKNKSDETE
jgi:uncharacterized membrane protein